MEKKIGLVDIAKRAGVSVATVSYALHGGGTLSDQTRQRIQKIASDLHYRPNVAAQGLRTHRSKIVCMLINNFNSVFNGTLIDDTRKALLAKGYALVVIGNSNAYLIDSQMFDGLIFWNHAIPRDELHALAKRVQLPIVLMADELDLPNVDNVVLANAPAINALMQYYEHSVHRKICFFRHSADFYNEDHGSYNSQQRMDAVIAYLSVHHPDIDVLANTYDGYFLFDRAYQLALDLLKKRRYDFFFCLNDMMAYGVYKAANELGLVVGEDISVVGFDNSPTSGTYYQPALTTIDSELGEWSTRVVDAITAKMAHPDKMHGHTIISPTTLVPGDSVKLATAVDSK